MFWCYVLLGENDICAWCYSEFTSTPDNLKNIPGHDASQIYDHSLTSIYTYFYKKHPHFLWLDKQKREIVLNISLCT